MQAAFDCGRAPAWKTIGPGGERSAWSRPAKLSVQSANAMKVPLPTEMPTLKSVDLTTVTSPQSGGVAVHPEPSAPTVEYPSTDGKAFAQNSWQAVAMALAREALHRHFGSFREDFCVGMDLLVYHKPGDNGNRLSPDVFVALGVPPRQRNSFRTWEEGKPPDFVLEVASRSSKDRDRLDKPGDYADIGVREYWVLDPRGDLFHPPLEGFRLEDGRYEPLVSHGLWDESEEFLSEALGLYLRTEQRSGVTVIIFRDTVTGEDVLAGRDIDRALREAQERFLAERRERLAEADHRKAETRRADAAEGRFLAERRERLAEADYRKAETRRADAAEGRASVAEARAGAAREETERYKQVIEELKRELEAATADSSPFFSERDT